MVYNEHDSINEINFTKRCILMSSFAQEKNIILLNSFHQIPLVKLFTADPSFENFIYSKIKGAFCLFMSKEKDIKNRKFYLRIYDIKDYTLLFNMEIKKEHMQYISLYKDDFYFMELRQSFIGFKFLSKESGRKFFSFLSEDPKKEILEQNEGAMNIKPKDVSKTTNKIIDYIKMRLKYKFYNSKTSTTQTTTTTGRKTKDISSSKRENFQTMIINDKKGEYLDTSIIPKVELLVNNIEIDEADSNVLFFTEKNLNYEKCKKILKKYENNMENSTYRRNMPNIPINIIDKDCKNIYNKQLYIQIMILNMLNNIRTQKRLYIFQQEHKKRHKGAPGIGRRRTKGRLTQVKRRDSRLSNLSKMSSGRPSYNEYNSEEKNRRATLNQNSSLKFNNDNNSLKNNQMNNNSTNIKYSAKSVDKENKGSFTKDKRKINSIESTEIFGKNDEEEINLEKGCFNYFNDNKKKNGPVDIIEERPEDEEKDREHKYKKRELKLPNKYITNINTNNIKNNNFVNKTNNSNNNNNISSRANIYKKPIAAIGGKAPMTNYQTGRGKK